MVGCGVWLMAGSDVYHLPVLPASIGRGVQLSAFEGRVLTGSVSVLGCVVGGNAEDSFGVGVVGGGSGLK